MKKKLTPGDIEHIFNAEGDDVLSKFAGDLRETFEVTPSSETKTRHLQAMASAFDLGEAYGPAPVRRRSLWLARTGTRVAVASVVVLAASGALAATDNLPGPAQDAIANVVELVGWDLPGGGHPNADGEPGTERAEQNRAEAKAFVAAKKAWNDCRQTARTEQPEADPDDVCGPQPNPHDFRSELSTEPGSDVPRTPNPAGHVPGEGGGHDEDPEGLEEDADPGRPDVPGGDNPKDEPGAGKNDKPPAHGNDD